MSDAVHIAIDQGGHATRAAAYDASGMLAGSALVTIATQHNALGHVEHDPDEVVASVTTALAELARLVPVARWAGAGFAVQRSSLVCWDAGDGRPLSPVISWQDRRNAQWLKGLARRADDVHRLTGLPLSPHYGASKLRWCLDHLPEVRSAAAQSRLHAGPLASYLLHRLLAERPFLADASTAARTLLWSPFERAWSDELLELFGIPRTLLPRSVGTAETFGTIIHDGKAIPVTICNGDQSVVPFAAGALDRQAAYVNLGTGAFVLRPTKDALLAPPLLTSVIRADARHFDFVLEGSVNGAGAALQWLERHQGAAADRMLSVLDGTALTDDGAPFFLNGVSGLGSPFWKPDFESRFVGEGSDLQQCRAVLESVAFLIKANLDEMDLHQPAPERLVASGGLAENRLLCRMLACLSEAPVDRSSDREASSRGLAFLVAGEPAGFTSSAVDRLEPEPDQQLLARYLKWLELMREAALN
ncbi:MAG: FGGY family carbohydrate kinase [Steroidobacteraceae bacterium]